jgi:hypothetical protein
MASKNGSPESSLPFEPNPLVSIGLPTYNGAAHLREALASLVGQDYPSLEILVSDNASTDGTAAIADEFAARDPRIRVVRQEANLGPVPNFEYVLRETAGPLFMWAADDDWWEPTYVSACVAALQRSPDAVLAATRIGFIGDDVDPEYVRDYAHFDNPDLSGASVRGRIRDLLSRHGWYVFYGLVRRRALERALPFNHGYGGDVVLVAELTLMAPFALVDEVLFHYRVYRSRATGRDHFDGRAPGERQAPFTQMLIACFRTIRTARVSPSVKLQAMVGLVEAACLRDTTLRTRIGGEMARRRRMAVAERRLPRLMKYLAIELLYRGRSAIIDLQGRLRRHA